MSSKKPQFTTFALDKLVDESIAEADQLSEELKNIDVNEIALNDQNSENFDDYIVESDKDWSEVADIIDKKSGESVSFAYVYKKICSLIDTGNATLQMLQSIDIDVLDPQMISATGSLINTIKGCIAEFTKIHQQWVKFNQTLKLENVKFENKKKLMKYRNDLINGVNSNSDTPQSTDLYEVKTSDLVEFLQWKKEKAEMEKEKENKI